MLRRDSEHPRAAFGPRAAPASVVRPTVHTRREQTNVSKNSMPNPAKSLGANVQSLSSINPAQVFNAHLEAFANQVDSLRTNGRLSGAERGALAEALLAVAGPSGPARIREVLRWLSESVQRRWVPAPGQVSPDVLHLASLRELAKGTSAGGREGLSEAHWELFHDVQLAERCLRRSAGDHDNNNKKISADGDGGSPDKQGDKPLGDKPQSYVPAGMVRPVDPPPPIEECPASDHLEWVL